MDINADNVVGEEIEDLTDNTGDGKLVWDDSHIEAFIICMEEEVNAGNRNNTTFSPNGWKNIRKGMMVRTGKNYVPKQLKSKFNHMRVDYKAFVSLLGETSVGYNAEMDIVIIENERWTRLIKYQKKPCNHFDKLTTIFGGTHATGAHVHTSYSPSILNQAPAHHEGTYTSFDLNDDFAELGRHEFTPSPEPRGKKPKRESFASTMDCIMEKMSDTYREKTDRIERAIVAFSSSNMKTVHEAGQVEVNSPDKTKSDFKLCCYILNKLEGVDMKQYAKVTQMLRNDEVWRDFFLNDLPDDKRMDIRTIIDLYDDGDEENDYVIIMAWAIDGTHVHANVPVDQQIPFRRRKGDTTQNVMAICDFDMMFTYVVAGWEGSANNSKILNETINNEDLHFLVPPEVMYKIQVDGPPCACGRGRMNLYTARTSKNYGHSFYRCPAWESYDRAFIWLDDMHQRLQVGGHVQEELEDVVAVMQAQENRQNYIIYGCCCCITITIFLLFLLMLLLLIIVVVEK
ncbi:uncharacterized protein LOC132277318 [Cornus florida]|uniref:uncharacterized protein LOC132277318 n=1 Tax=Cornus florida TaxID=4283 RepID=UPI00289986AE|nr:uncharacterized protein LOC132277318 [Cornus florida]